MFSHTDLNVYIHLFCQLYGIYLMQQLACAHSNLCFCPRIWLRKLDNAPISHYNIVCPTHSDIRENKTIASWKLLTQLFFANLNPLDFFRSNIFAHQNAGQTFNPHVALLMVSTGQLQHFIVETLQSNTYTHSHNETNAGVCIYC